jgi:tetratricopeptide (TPR) repeat protein
MSDTPKEISRPAGEGLVKEHEVASWIRCVPPPNEELAAAAAAAAENPDSGQRWMQKGHAYAKMNYMREAADCYAMSIACDPFNWEYYRHRAHRFLSCWRFSDAAADFTLAARLNPADWNVWYHLGLSWFLLGRYDKAAEAYDVCYRLSGADAELIAISDWYWITLRRLGREKEAAAVLERIHSGMDAGENGAYFARLMMYKGLKKPEELLGGDAKTLDIITMGFGVANYYSLVGQREKCDETLEKVIRAGDENNLYFAFAYLAAMVDIAGRAKGCPPAL